MKCSLVKISETEKPKHFYNIMFLHDIADI